jgi:hypothetical protein
VTELKTWALAFARTIVPNPRDTVAVIAAAEVIMRWLVPATLH